MRKGEIIQENLRLKSQVNHYRETLFEAENMIDALSKKISELEAWKARMENDTWKHTLDL